MSSASFSALTHNRGARIVVAILVVAALVILTVSAWAIGRTGAVESPQAQQAWQGTQGTQGNSSGQGAQNAQSGQQAAYDGTETGYASYDIGPATKPTPTGKVREFELVAKEVSWEIAPGVKVPAISYNGQVPGPTIRVTEGDTVRVTLKNELQQPTSIHWHGLHVPNSMDGVPPLTQKEIAPGESFTYEFTASHAGTFMYHSHQNAVEQIDRGLYAPFIIDSVDPAAPAKAKFDKEFTMMLSAWNTASMPASDHMMPGMGGSSQPEPMQGSGQNSGSSSASGGMNMSYNYFTINGKAYPSNETWKVKEGDLVRVRVINISNLVHPMHLHGHDFTVVAKDGEPIRPQAQQTMNTLSVNAGETYDIVFRADNPGTWVFHCHELHHTENDGVEMGGLIQPIQYEGVAPFSTQNQSGSGNGGNGGNGGSLDNMQDLLIQHVGMLTGTVWIANEQGNSLTVLDASTNKVVTTLTGIEGPHNVQVAPDGKTVWAVSGHENLAVAIDARTYAVVGTVPVGKEPAHIVLTADGTRAYVTNGADNSVSVIDVAGMKVVATIQVGQYPHGLRPSPDGKWVYVANVNSNTLSVIDTATNEKVEDIQVGAKPVQVGFSPDGKYVYFSLNGENAVGKVDVVTRKFIGKVAVGDGPVQVYVSGDGKYLLAANQGTAAKPSASVSIIDTASFKVLKTVDTGKGAHGVVIDPGSRHAYITNIYGNSVAVLDLVTQTLVGTVPTGDSPNGISMSADAPAAAPGPEVKLQIGAHNDGNAPKDDGGMQNMP